MDPKAKSAIRGAFLGFYVDIFDIYLPIVVLAPALIYFVSPQIGGTASAIVGASIFAAALVGRPVGALIFGRFADTIGRRKTTIIAVSGFGATTLLLALMPGYQQIGITAVIIFIVLRFVDGVFLGGEYTSASPLAMEYSPREKRGLYGALIMTGFPLAYATISLITMFLLFLMPSEGLDSAYVQWGWRIPFLIGAALAFGFVLYYARSVSESEVFEQSGGSESPIKDLFSGDNLKNFLQVFVMMTGFWLTLNMVSAALPGLLGDPVGLSSTGVTIALVIANLVLAGGYVAAGVISQRVGRRPFLMAMGAIMAVVGTFLYYLLVSAAPDNLFVVIVLTTLITVLVVSPWGLATTYINERFQTGVRASGFGLGYSLAVIIPSFYAFYQAGLATFMPPQYTALVLLVIGALLIVVGAAWGPETKHVDFAEEPEVSGPRTPPRRPRPARTVPDLMSPGTRLFDLEQPRTGTMPIHPAHRQAGYSYFLHRRHEDEYHPEESGPRTGAAGVLVCGEHTGTHIDALSHQADALTLCGGVPVGEVQTSRGFTEHGVEKIPPIVAPGVLLDVAALEGVEALGPGHVVTGGHLEACCGRQGVEVSPGGVALVRTGNGRFWGDEERYLAGPGMDAGASRWLADRGVIAVGADNMAWDVPGLRDPELGCLLAGHLILLARRGVYIVENLALEELAAAGHHRFEFVCLPLKLVGATGSPVRPAALVAGDG